MTKHKQPLLLLVLLAMLWSVTSNTHAEWFNNNNAQQQQEIDKLKGEVDQERQTNDGMGVVIIILGIGCVVTLLVGTIIGSKARKAANEQRQ